MEAASSVETLGTIIDMTSYPWMLASPSTVETLVVSPDSAVLQAVGRLLGYCNLLNRNIFFCFAILLRYNVLFLLAENLLAAWVTISFSGMPVLHVLPANTHSNQASTSRPISLLITSLCPHQGSCPYAQRVAVLKLCFTLPGSLRDPRKLALFNDIFNCWSYIASAIDQYGAMVEWQWQGETELLVEKPIIMRRADLVLWGLKLWQFLVPSLRNIIQNY